MYKHGIKISFQYPPRGIQDSASVEAAGSEYQKCNLRPSKDSVRTRFPRVYESKIYNIRNLAIRANYIYGTRWSEKEDEKFSSVESLTHLAESAETISSLLPILYRNLETWPNAVQFITM